MDFILYVIFSLIVAIILSLKTDKKLLSFIIIFFILAQPVLTFNYIIDLPGLFFDLQPNRILLFIMLGFLAVSLLKKASSGHGHRKVPAFEKLLYIYLFLVLTSLIWNFKAIQAKTLLVIPAEILLFIFLYNVLKREVTLSVLEAFVKAIVVLGLVMAIIAIYQMLIDQSFLRTCNPRFAFGGRLRSTAIYFSENEFGYVMNFAIVVFLVRYKNRTFLWITLPLLIIGLILTFHRLNWLIFIVCLTSFLFLIEKRKLAVLMLMLSLLLSTIITLAYFINPGTFEQVAQQEDVRSFTEEKLLKDTLSQRLYSYSVALEVIVKHVMGFGAPENKEYIKIMSERGLVYQRGKTVLAVHNGYLDIGLMYGIPTMIIFCWLLISMLFYFKRHITADRLETAYPYYAVLIFILGMITQPFGGFRIYYVLIIAIFCGSSSSVYAQYAKKSHSKLLHYDQ